MKIDLKEIGAAGICIERLPQAVPAALSGSLGTPF